MSDQKENSLRILLAEDDESARESFAMFLELLGYTVDRAKDGQEALRIAQSGAADYFLLLTDYDMPGLNGIKLIERIAQTSVEHFGHFILMSSFPEKSPQIEPVKSLPVPIYFLQKSLLPEQLERLLDERRSVSNEQTIPGLIRTPREYGRVGVASVGISPPPFFRSNTSRISHTPSPK